MTLLIQIVQIQLYIQNQFCYSTQEDQDTMLKNIETVMLPQPHIQVLDHQAKVTLDTATKQYLLTSQTDG